MSTKVKSFFFGSVAFLLFAVMRPIVPLHNMEFFVGACAIFAIVFLLTYNLVSSNGNGARPW